MGKPSSAMKYDPVKGRYVFDGESESDEEPVKAPPKKNEQPADEPKEEKPKEEEKEQTGAASLT